MPVVVGILASVRVVLHVPCVLSRMALVRMLGFLACGTGVRLGRLGRNRMPIMVHGLIAPVLRQFVGRRRVILLGHERRQSRRPTLSRYGWLRLEYEEEQDD